MRDVRGELNAVIAEVFAVDPTTISSDHPWSELGVESLDLVEFVIAVHERFDVNLEAADLPNLRTVEDLARYLETRVLQP